MGKANKGLVLIVEGKTLSMLDSIFIDIADRKIRYFRNGEKIWFSFVDVLYAIGITKHKSTLLAEVVKGSHFAKVKFGKAGIEMWFCNIEGIEIIVHFIEDWAFGCINEKRYNSVLFHCGELVGNGYVSGYKVAEEKHNDREKELPKLT